MEGLCLVLVTQLFLSSAASASPTSDDQVPAQLSLVGAEEIFQHERGLGKEFRAALCLDHKKLALDRADGRL